MMVEIRKGVRFFKIKGFRVHGDGENNSRVEAAALKKHKGMRREVYLICKQTTMIFVRLYVQNLF